MRGELPRKTSGEVHPLKSSPVQRRVPSNSPTTSELRRRTEPLFHIPAIIGACTDSSDCAEIQPFFASSVSEVILSMADAAVSVN